jgi:hypothetical protein
MQLAAPSFREPDVRDARVLGEGRRASFRPRSALAALAALVACSSYRVSASARRDPKKGAAARTGGHFSVARKS